MSARSGIVEKLTEKLKEIDGLDPWKSNLYANVENRKVFWDEVDDFPYISVSAGNEARQYLPSNFKWGFVSIHMYIYVRGENPEQQLEDVIRDVELCIEQNRELNWDPDDPCKTTTDLELLTIETDGGIMEPLGIAEMVFLARYEMKF